MSTPEPTVFVVDDDTEVRNSLCWLISLVKLPVQGFASAHKFLEAVQPDQAGCVIIDVRMPGMSGLQLQETLTERSSQLSTIFITGHADVPMAVRAMKAGALEFIEKPFNDQEILELVQKALQQSVETVRKLEQRLEVQRRLDLMTPRERDILNLIVAGEMNKRIAHHFGISERTVEVHRARVMGKMRAKSLAKLVEMVTKLSLAKEGS